MRTDAYPRIKDRDFTKFSCEPTFYSELVGAIAGIFKPDFRNALFENLSDALANTFIQKVKIYRGGKQISPCNDAGALELRPGIHDGVEEYLKTYRGMTRGLKKLDFIPSSLVDMDTEGGCHMNFDLRHLRSCGADFVREFVTNLRNLLYDNPSAVWAFLSPNANNCSHIVMKELFGGWGSGYYKGHFLTLRDRRGRHCTSPTTLSYVELRFFMMPRSSQEMVLHYDFCRALLRHVFEMTRRSGISLAKRKAALHTYTREKALTELQEFCRTIGIKYSRLQRLGKTDNLVERIKYGKKWMV